MEEIKTLLLKGKTMVSDVIEAEASYKPQTHQIGTGKQKISHHTLEIQPLAQGATGSGLPYMREAATRVPGTAATRSTSTRLGEQTTALRSTVGMPELPWGAGWRPEAFVWMEVVPWSTRRHPKAEEGGRRPGMEPACMGGGRPTLW